jgi:hypothetical protein
MRKPIFLLPLSLFLFSCGNEQPATDAPPPPVKAETAVPTAAECYIYTTPGRDTFHLRTVTEGVNVTGTLTYDFSEKDRSTGTFSGTMSGDVLIADYTFQSEGTTSVRQVAFKRSGDVLIEGHAAMEVKGDKTAFVSTDSLDFTPVVIYSKTDCPGDTTEKVL